MDKRVGVVDVNKRAGLVNLDTTLPDTDVTAIELSHIPDAMPGDVLNVTVENGKVVRAERVTGVRSSVSVNSA